jgi:predicted dehydrogenase (TIGR03970 family)
LTTLHSDVLVVGAGSAGSVIAERLSADSGCRVIVLEAGGELTDPGLLARAGNGLELPIGAASPLVRRYRTELTGSGNQTTIVRGAVVGGSGAVNGGYFCRGLPRDFDRSGLPGWGWPDVLDHFRAIENDMDFPGHAHGVDGPIAVRRTREAAGVSEAFVAAADRCGFSWVGDFNEPGAGSGFGAVPLNIVDGLRTGPGGGYLMPALDRPNLALLPRTEALRLRITAGRAVGADAVGPDGSMTVRAERTVLCAGAIESAHLLMLSGVGDEAMLATAGVKVVEPLPVGSFCSDHPEWLLPVNWPVVGRRPPLEFMLTTPDDIEIRPYTQGFAAMVGDAATDNRDRPHIGVALMQPRARGRITLASADPRVAPRIEHRYDSEPGDIAALRRGVEVVRELAGDAVDVSSPIWSTSQHLCGSTPMGTGEDEWAVVDPRCRVRGIEGLWVVDGSVLPSIVSRGPHATVVMLGHRGAEFVRAG